MPKDRILLGAKGSTSSRHIMKLAREAVRQGRGDHDDDMTLTLRLMILMMMTPRTC